MFDPTDSHAVLPDRNRSAPDRSNVVDFAAARIRRATGQKLVDDANPPAAGHELATTELVTPRITAGARITAGDWVRTSSGLLARVVTTYLDDRGTLRAILRAGGHIQENHPAHTLAHASRSDAN